MAGTFGCSVGSAGVPQMILDAWGFLGGFPQMECYGGGDRRWPVFGVG